MLDQLFNNLAFLPLVSFMTGLAGSPHCILMCGGLVQSSCRNEKDNFQYQIGRLISYLTLVFIFSSFKIYLLSFLNLKLSFLVSGIILGFIFIVYGLSQFELKFFKMRIHQSLSAPYLRLWRYVSSLKIFVDFRPFFTGLISVMLPCGLLYGAIFSTASFEGHFSSLIGIFLFWLGTLPAMFFANHLIQKLLMPIKTKLPKLVGVLLIFIGLSTIIYRYDHFKKHENLETKKGGINSSSNELICH